MSRRDLGRGGSRQVVCLLGGHNFGKDHSVGAGIERRVCERCGAVTIDLTMAEGSGDAIMVRQPATSPGSGH